MHVETCGDESFTIKENLLHVHVNNVLCDMYSNTGIFSKLSYLFIRYSNNLLKCMRKRVEMKALQSKKI